VSLQGGHTKFESRSAEEITATSLWQGGIYDFFIVEAQEKTSRRGNEMIEVYIEITRRDGAKKCVRDYLLPQRPMKLLKACKACGVEDKYRAGILSDDDLVGKRGKLKLGIERATVEFPRRNVVVDYLWENGDET
jgi:hypothetical protein